MAKGADKSVGRNSESAKEALEFALQKFLIKTEMIEAEQKLLGNEMEKLWQAMRMKKAYHHIVTKH
jgi:hypothetical protein